MLLQVKNCLISFAALSLLCGCGFTPLYGAGEQGAYNAQNASAAQSTNVAAGLDQIAIGNIPDRDGQALRNHLIDRFYQSGYPQAPRYRLDVNPLNEVRRALDITKQSDATRGQLRLQTSIALIDTQTNKIVLERSFTSVTSYNVLESQFTTRVSQNAARESALQDLARQIELQVALFLKRG